MKVLLLSRYEKLGATSRVRFYQYLPGLERAGFEFTVEPFLSDRYLTELYSGKGRRPGSILPAYAKRLRAIRRARDFDLIWVEKEILPWMPAGAERKLNALGIPYVVDYDDATFHAYDRHRLSAVRSRMSTKIDEVMRRATTVVAGNSYLADRAKTAGASHVEIVPTVVDTERYGAVSSASQAEQNFDIGWIGTPSTSKYLAAVDNALASVCSSTNARLVTVGAGDLATLSCPHLRHAWSEADEVEQIQRFQCGIMPLPDEEWERGKCGYKLIQYMACGLPVVASPVGINREIVTHGENGFLANSDSEWTASLLELCHNPARRYHMGEAARRTVELTYSLSVTLPGMVTLLSSSGNAKSRVPLAASVA